MKPKPANYLLTRRQTIAGLKYIANSPPQEHGGFHPETVLIAKSALMWLTKKVRPALTISVDGLG